MKYNLMRHNAHLHCMIMFISTVFDKYLQVAESIAMMEQKRLVNYVWDS